jgi:hypothetical protein
MGATLGAQLTAADVLLLGRRTYEEFLAYWPTATTADNPMAERMYGIPKLVASTTRDTVTWENATLVSGDAHPGRYHPAGHGRAHTARDAPRLPGTWERP